MQTTGKGYEYPDTTDAVSSYPAVAQNNAQLDDARPGISVVTTTARNAYAGTDLWTGRTIWNTTTSEYEQYNGSAWVVAFSSVSPATTVTGPDAFGAAAAVGTSALFARADHDHGLPANPTPGYATNTIALGTAAAAGAAAGIIRPDATILAFDATTPTTLTSGEAAATGTAATAARRDHIHGMPTIPAPSAMTQIANTVLGAAAASITFSSIPGTYNHLKLRAVGRSTLTGGSSDHWALRVNGDAGADYAWAMVYWSAGGATASSGESGVTYIAGNNNVYDLASAGDTAGYASTLDIDLPLYAGTTFTKIGRWVSMRADVPQGLAAIGGWNGAIEWGSTAAVTSLTIFPVTGPDLVAGSAAYLYGVT